MEQNSHMNAEGHLPYNWDVDGIAHSKPSPAENVSPLVSDEESILAQTKWEGSPLPYYIFFCLFDVR